MSNYIDSKEYERVLGLLVDKNMKIEELEGEIKLAHDYISKLENRCREHGIVTNYQASSSRRGA